MIQSPFAAVVGLAGNRQLDIALEPILLKLQLPMAMNLREEARHRRPETASTGTRRSWRRWRATIPPSSSRRCTTTATWTTSASTGPQPLQRALTQSTHSRPEIAIILSTIDSHG